MGRCATGWENDLEFFFDFLNNLEKIMLWQRPNLAPRVVLVNKKQKINTLYTLLLLGGISLTINARWKD